MKFWDTSALVPLFLDEPQTTRCREVLAADPGMVIWWSAPVESMSALARSLREGRLEEEDYEEGRKAVSVIRAGAYEIQPSDQVRSRAVELLNRHPLRAADALHLGAALTWCRDETAGREFVCLDVRLREAAARKGFVVVPDGI